MQLIDANVVSGDVSNVVAGFWRDDPLLAYYSLFYVINDIFDNITLGLDTLPNILTMLSTEPV